MKYHVKKRILAVLLTVLCSTLAVGCLKEGEDTIILPPYPLEDKPTTGYGDGTTDAVIPESIRETFKNHMPIHEGKYPPVIEGQFLESPVVIVYTSDNQFEPGKLFADKYFAFTNQTTDGICQGFFRELTATGHADTIWIVGQGNKFTAFYVEKGTYNDSAGTWYITSNLVSGEVTTSGIKDFYQAFIMLDKYDPTHIIMDVNEYRIFKDEDGLAENDNWRESKGQMRRSLAGILGTQCVPPSR